MLGNVCDCYLNDAGWGRFDLDRRGEHAAGAAGRVDVVHLVFRRRSIRERTGLPACGDEAATRSEGRPAKSLIGRT